MHCELISPKSTPGYFSHSHRYFLFQAALIPCICLRSQPTSSRAPGWRSQVETTLSVMKLLGEWTHSSRKCCDVLWRLCGEHLMAGSSVVDANGSGFGSAAPANNALFSSIWPGTYPIANFDDDVAMTNDFWEEFLRDGL